jgi:hypothetical protein
VLFWTVTFSFVVEALPEVSVARAESVCEPAASIVVSSE